MSKRVKPQKVRGRQLEEVREKDPDGRIVYHHRTVDTLGKEVEKSKGYIARAEGVAQAKLEAPASPFEAIESK